jgi:hypothetical protein
MVWVVEEREDEAQARLEAALGPLSLWEPAAPPPPGPRPTQGVLDPATGSPCPPWSGTTISTPSRVASERSRPLVCRQGLWRHPHRQAAALLERPVVGRPVGHLVARPGDLVAARLIGLVGHRSSTRRGDPILSARPGPGLNEATGRDLCTNTAGRYSRWSGRNPCRILGLSHQRFARRPHVDDHR